MNLWVSTVAVLAHLVVVFLHGFAHSELRVELNAWQKAYVMTVILVAPVVAMVLLWTRHARVGFLALIISTFGALVFGVYHHYLLVSPDHVSHLPPGDARGLFRLTALLLVVTEAFAVVVGLWGLRRMRMREQVV